MISSSGDELCAQTGNAAASVTAATIANALKYRLDLVMGCLPMEQNYRRAARWNKSIAPNSDVRQSGTSADYGNPGRPKSQKTRIRRRFRHPLDQRRWDMQNRFSTRPSPGR